MGVKVGIGVLVGVRVLVGIGVLVDVGVSVGPNNLPGLHALININKTIREILADRFMKFLL